MRHNSQDFIYSPYHTNRETLDILYLDCNANSGKNILGTIYVWMSCVYVWLIALLPFFKNRRDTTQFLQVCTHNSLFPKNGRSQENKWGTIGDILISVWGSFEN